MPRLPRTRPRPRRACSDAQSNGPANPKNCESRDTSRYTIYIFMTLLRTFRVRFKGRRGSCAVADATGGAPLNVSFARQKFTALLDGLPALIGLAHRRPRLPDRAGAPQPPCAA